MLSLSEINQLNPNFSLVLKWKLPTREFTLASSSPSFLTNICPWMAVIWRHHTSLPIGSCSTSKIQWEILFSSHPPRCSRGYCGQTFKCSPHTACLSGARILRYPALTCPYLSEPTKVVFTPIIVAIGGSGGFSWQRKQDIWPSMEAQDQEGARYIGGSRALRGWFGSSSSSYGDHRSAQGISFRYRLA